MPVQGSKIVAMQQMEVAGELKQEREDVLGSTLLVTAAEVILEHCQSPHF